MLRAAGAPSARRSAPARCASPRRTPRRCATFQTGEVLVTGDDRSRLGAVMQAAPRPIVTDRGGRTCHAAIVRARARHPVRRRHRATPPPCCARASPSPCRAPKARRAWSTDGLLAFERDEIDVARAAAATRTQICSTSATPSRPSSCRRCPCDGVGLARMEFIISNCDRHPPDGARAPRAHRRRGARAEIAERTRGYAESAPTFFVERLAEGVAQIAAAFYPRPVIVRLSRLQDQRVRRPARRRGLRAAARRTR